MERAQPGAKGSYIRNIEYGEAASPYSNGFIQSASDPTLSSIRYDALDESLYNEFDASWSDTSLDVTIDPGEGFINGWFATDEQTTINLEADVNDQTVVVGWDVDAVYDDTVHGSRDDADSVFVHLKSSAAFDPNDPYIEIWTFDTDSNGVTNAVDERPVGEHVDFFNAKYDQDSDGAVDVIGENAISSTEMQSGSVGSDQIAAGAVGATQIENGSIGSDQLDNNSVESINTQEADKLVTVGPDGDFSTINAAIRKLTEERPAYSNDRYRAVVQLQDDFIMEEQVLVDGLDLSWIWIQTERGTTVGSVEDFAQGTQISDYDRPEITNVEIADYPVNSEWEEDNSRFLDGEYVAFDGGNDGTGDAYYFWFNVTDATDLSFVDSNAGDPNPDPVNFSGVDSFTSVQVDILLEDSASQVIGKLQTEVDAQAEFSATVNSNTLSVTNADTGNTDLNPTSSTSEFSFTTTAYPSDGSYPDTFSVTEVNDADWVIDSELDPTLTLVRGYTYTFNMDTSGHPIRFQDVEGAYDSTAEWTDGVTVTSGDRETGTVEFTVPDSAPDELYFVSENSGDMVGTLSINDQGEGLEPVATAKEFDSTLATYDSSGTVNEVFVDDATVLNGNYIEMEVHDGSSPQPIYFWFNVNGNGTDPAVSGTGYEVTLSQGATPETAASELQSIADGPTEADATVSTTRTVQITNVNSGEVADAEVTGSRVTSTTIQEGRGAGYYVQVNLTGHGLSEGDRIRITGHSSGQEEFNYNGTWFVTNVTTDAFELDYVSDNDAVYDSTRAQNPTTATVEKPEPVPVTRAALDETWEFFYQPAFGVARGTLPTIDCLFDMDTSGSNSYLSYKDGLCATDGGIINITPFNGFINAGGSNIYATRRSAINANDAIANGAGRMGVWAYSNSLINARRVEAKNCGLAGSGSDTGNGFDSAGRPVGNGVNATRGSLVNAAGVTTGGCQGDNIYASYGGQINLEGHASTPTFDTASVNGQDVNIDGGQITRSDGTEFDKVTAGEIVADTISSSSGAPSFSKIEDDSGNTMLQGVVATGQTTLSSGLAEFSTNISQTDATFMLALGIDDPNADAEVAGSLFWDDDAGNYEIRIRETQTSVGNPTVNYDVLRVR